jgi:hypothetical protein
MGSPVQGVSYMKKVFVLAVIGAACSSVAFAGEVKQTKAAAPVVKATTMSDNDMDKVTAGFSINQQQDHTPGWDKNFVLGTSQLGRGGCNRLNMC